MAGIDDFRVTDPTTLPTRAPTREELEALALVGARWQDQEVAPGLQAVPEEQWRYYWLPEQPDDTRDVVNALLAWAIAQEAGSVVPTTLAWTDTTGADIGGMSSGLANGTLVTVIFTGGLSASGTVANNAWSVTAPAGVQSGPITASASLPGGGAITTPNATYTVPVTSTAYSETFAATQNIIDNGYTLAYAPTDPNMSTLIGHMAGDNEAVYGTQYTITNRLLEFVGEVRAIVLVGDEFTVEYTA